MMAINQYKQQHTYEDSFEGARLWRSMRIINRCIFTEIKNLSPKFSLMSKWIVFAQWHPNFQKTVISIYISRKSLILFSA